MVWERRKKKNIEIKETKKERKKGRRKFNIEVKSSETKYMKINEEKEGKLKWKKAWKKENKINRYINKQTIRNMKKENI